MLKKKNNFPQKPGVYLFKSRNKILYIGKAKNLKNRISQYFHKEDDIVIGNLLKQAVTIETIVTDDEKDALQLEYNLIHQYQPPFNIRLKDDKTFPFIELSVQDDVPGIYLTRQPDHNNFVLGPVVAVKKAKDLLDIVIRIFKIRSCSNTVFNKKRICLYYHIDRCLAPCEGKVSSDEYRDVVKGVINFLKGKKGDLLNQLKTKMQILSDRQNYEEAQKVKDDLLLIREFDLDSYISSPRRIDHDVISCFDDGRQFHAILFSVVQGNIQQKEFFSFDSIRDSNVSVMREFLISYYKKGNIPDEILMQSLPPQAEDMEEMFSGIRGKKVKIRVPIRGKKNKILQLAVNNLNLYIQKNNYDILGENIQRHLFLKNFPGTIEAIDISHFSERDRVGAVVVYQKGSEVRRLYRNYLIKSAGSGDVAAIEEVMIRRYGKKKIFPDLIIIDGGKGQLGIAKSLKKKYQITSDLVAIAKREERIYLENGRSMVFDDGTPERFLFQNIRDEVHRRAITHHRKRRQKLP